MNKFAKFFRGFRTNDPPASIHNRTFCLSDRFCRAFNLFHIACNNSDYSPEF